MEPQTTCSVVPGVEGGMLVRITGVVLAAGWVEVEVCLEGKRP